jgi:hypothetical protein
MVVHSNYDGRAAHAGKEDCPDNIFIVRGIDFSSFFCTTLQVYRAKSLVKLTLFKNKK